LSYRFHNIGKKTCGRERTQNGSRLWLTLVKCKYLRIKTEYSKAITLLLK